MASLSACGVTQLQQGCRQVLKIPLESRFSCSFGVGVTQDWQPRGTDQLFFVAAESRDPGLDKAYTLKIAGGRRDFSLHVVPSDKRIPENFSLEDDAEVLDYTDTGNGDGNVGGSKNGFGGGGGDDEGPDGDGEGEDEDFGPLLNGEEVRRLAQGVQLPAEMASVSDTLGIRQVLLQRYLQMQENGLLGAAIRGSSLLRNRMLADPSFLFKVFTEVAIDSACATFAEVQKRGKDFWNEFELYLSDLFVGIVLDVALVGLLAPYVQFGAKSSAKGLRNSFSRAIQALPSSVFEATRPGRKFTIPQRGMSFVLKAGQYGVMGFSCGLIGQGIASSIMTLKRKWQKSEEEEVAVPDILRSAAVWGGFMALSSNTRYQIINGLESVVERSILARNVPVFAMAFTVAIRFANNIYGGMQFVDWARMSGVQ